MTPQRWRKLQAFHMLMKTGSVTQAAEALSISQPAASKLLQALEAETRLVLFDRTRRNLLPTPDAVRLHVEVERLFRTASGIDDLANDIRSAGVGELRVAALPVFGLGPLPGWIAAFARLHPGIKVSFTVVPSPQVLRNVIAGEVDVGFARTSLREPTVTRQPLVELPGIIVMPQRHRLAARKSLVPKDLEGEAFISLSRQDEARETVDSLFESHGVSRQIGFETNLTAAACALAAEGAGVAMVFVFSPRLIQRGLVLRPIHPTVRFKMDTLTAVGRPTSEMTRQFLQFIHARLDELDLGGLSPRFGVGSC